MYNEHFIARQIQRNYICHRGNAMPGHGYEYVSASSRTGQHRHSESGLFSLVGRR